MPGTQHCYGLFPLQYSSVEQLVFHEALSISSVVTVVRLAATGAVHNSCENFAEAQKVLEEAKGNAGC